MRRHLLFLTTILVMLTLSACSTTTPSREKAPKLTSADYNIRLGLGYLKQGDRERALHKLLLATEQAPRSTVAMTAMAYYLNATGQFERAEVFHKRALAIAPRDGKVLNNYGVFLCQRAHYSRAVKQFIKATHDTNYLAQAEAFENAGLCSLKIPNKVAAVKYFKAALARSPERRSALLQLTYLLYNQGQYQSAQGYLARYKRLGGSKAVVQRLQTQLAKAQSTSFSASNKDAS